MSSQNPIESIAVANLQWLSGDIVLPHSQIHINLSPKVRIKYIGNGPMCKAEEAQGYLTYKNNDPFLEFLLDYNIGPENPVRKLFIPAHEEGHLCQVTGNLLALYQKASRLGLDFDFLTEEAMCKSDAYARAQLDVMPTKIWDLYDQSLDISDDKIADVAGLIALVKAGVDDKLIQAVTKEIKSVGFFRNTPDLLKHLDQH